MEYIINASTNVGIARKNNQDGVIAQLAKNAEHSFLLVAVCDGMGGLSAGEVASATVIYALKNWFDKQLLLLNEDSTIQQLNSSCADMLATLNVVLKDYEVQTHKLMGTTLSCLIALDDAYAIIHIGDSRIYHIGKELSQLTLDHTVVAEAVRNGMITPEEAGVSRDRNKLSQCIGASKRYEPQILFGRVHRDDVFLLCSDGFRHRLSENAICRHFQADALKNEREIKRICEQSIEYVMSQNEKDNISVAVIKAR